MTWKTRQTHVMKARKNPWKTEKKITQLKNKENRKLPL